MLELPDQTAASLLYGFISIRSMQWELILAGISSCMLCLMLPHSLLVLMKITLELGQMHWEHGHAVPGLDPCLQEHCFNLLTRLLRQQALSTIGLQNTMMACQTGSPFLSDLTIGAAFHLSLLANCSGSINLYDLLWLLFFGISSSMVFCFLFGWLIVYYRKDCLYSLLFCFSFLTISKKKNQQVFFFFSWTSALWCFCTDSTCLFQLSGTEFFSS